MQERRLERQEEHTRCCSIAQTIDHVDFQMHAKLRTKLCFKLPSPSPVASPPKISPKLVLDPRIPCAGRTLQGQSQAPKEVVLEVSGVCFQFSICPATEQQPTQNAKRAERSGKALTSGNEVCLRSSGPEDEGGLQRDCLLCGSMVVDSCASAAGFRHAFLAIQSLVFVRFEAPGCLARSQTATRTTP